MQTADDVRLCPPCKRGKHERHQYDYLDAENRVTLCRCIDCVTQRIANRIGLAVGESKTIEFRGKTWTMTREQ